jgi:alpha-galactosidase
MKQSITARAADIDFLFSVETQTPVHPALHVEVTTLEDMNESYLLHLTVEVPNHPAFILRDLSVEWTLPITDMHGLYFGGNPMAELSYLPFWQINKQICANTGVPYMALIHRSGENRAAFGVFDQITETSIRAELSEITRCYRFRLQKPANKDSIGQVIPVEGSWEEFLFVSKAQQPWSEVLRHYVQLCDAATHPTKMPVPDHAFDPVFCSWTAIHHDVSHDWIMRNARLAADLGFRTWITDDGWFIEKGQFADYSFAGDWLPCDKKFPDFREHVRAVQAMGLRYVLWVAPFMVGKSSQAAQRYAHLLTTGQEHLRFNNLSPWHDETRQIIAGLLQRLVSDYGLDGLKIDFLDSISIHSARKDGAADQTLGSSYARVLQEATDCLLTTHPDLLIEFRNTYANLASRSYANIYRSSDVPINFSLNRWQAVMLRLLVPDRAVHLDPALWHPDESDENVAVHLLNLLVSVPMVSIELDQYPPRHLDLIRYWIGFYNAHRETIIRGEFKPVLRQGYIAAIHFVGTHETIIGLYDDIPVTLGANAETVWILNGSTRPTIDLAPPGADGVRTVIVRSKFGEIVSQEDRCFPLAQLSVQVGGSVEIKPHLPER